MTPRVPCTVAAALLICAPAFGQPYRPIRLDRPLTFDGRVTEVGWQSADPLPLTMMFPVFEGEMRISSEIRIAYDDEYLYASGRFESSARVARSLDRDRAADADEMFGIVIDTFDDNENALIFITTPAGIRVDQTVFGDAQMLNEEMPVNESWNTFWDVATTETDGGWEVEMRIPWSSLRFQDEDGRVRMGLLAWRWSPSDLESHTFPPIDPKWGLMGPMKPSIAHPIEFEGVYAKRPVYITPYVLGGGTREASQDPGDGAWGADSDLVREAGLDVKVGLTSNMTLDLTLNTDFAQVEADDIQVNLTRFSLFFPEKRQFFQERSSIFEFNTGGQTRLFYSRTVGLSDEGTVPLLGGFRAVGRIGGWDVGVMDLQTGRADFETDDGPLRIPSENFGIARVRRRVFNPFSYAGGILTSRLAEDGSYNVALGVDGTLRLREQDYLLLGWAQTFDDTVSTSLGGPSSTLARIRFERRTNTGLAWEVGVTRAGEGYVPDMGFLFRTDFTQLGDRVYLAWQPGTSSPFYSLQAGFTADVYLRNSDGSLESARYGPQVTAMLRSGAFGLVQPSLYVEDLREPFELSDDLEIPVGRYRFAGIMAMLSPSPRPLRATLTLDAGTFYDGWRVSVGLEPTWNLSRHLELSGELQMNRIRFPDRAESLDADIARLRVRAALDTHLSLSAFVQYDRAENEIGVNARLRYNFREGNDLFIVFNEGLNTRRDRERSRLPLSESRALLLKYTYTFGS